MPLRVADAFILRTYPLKESDKIVSFFTREWGKRRGVARAASRPKSKFGSTLEPLSLVRVQYFEREGKDLSNLDHCELLASMVEATGKDLEHAVAVSVMVEVADRMLPEHEVSDSNFRLLQAVTEGLRSEPDKSAWLPLTYYLYWMVRLGGFLPELPLTPAATALAEAISRHALPNLPAEAAAVAAGSAGCELRARLRVCLEGHLEAPLRTWPMLAGLESETEL
ncbi:MAG: DNA repair protein RecO [Terriglobales bacterium]